MGALAVSRHSLAGQNLVTPGCVFIPQAGYAVTGAVWLRLPAVSVVSPVDGDASGIVDAFPLVLERFCMIELRALIVSLMVLLLPLNGAAETLRLVADRWPPFTGEHLPYNGLASDLVTTALQRAGYATTYVEVPWERAIRGVQRGDYDVLVDAWFSEERAAFGHFSQPYLINRVRFLQRKDAGIRYQQLSDLYPYSVAVVRGYAYGPTFDQDTQLRKVAVTDFAIAARMLHARRVQLTLEDELVARYHLGRDKEGIGDELEFLPTPLSENGLHALVSRQHPDHRKIAEDFDAALDAMRADGTYDLIMRRHGL